MKHIERVRPASVLDVGIGWGKFGFLLRDRIDNFRGDMVIDGVEIFGPYLDQGIQKHIYDYIFNENFLDIVGLKKNQYDLVLMIDVLEHFTDAQGSEALYKAMNVGREVIVATPLGYAQGAVYGNQHEAHRSEWPFERLAIAAEHDGRRAYRIHGGTHDSVLCFIK